MNQQQRVGVVGAGAAGFFAAIRAARLGAHVTILEKSRKVLSKVKVSGGGRCNVTNGNFDLSQLDLYYPRGARELKSAFTRFGPGDTVEWYKAAGVILKTEADGRMFPVTDNSQTIIDCLMNEALFSGVEIFRECHIRKFEKKDDTFIVYMDNHPPLEYDALILCTGGSPQRESYEWLTAGGHTLINPVPSLFTFNIPESPINDLMGLSLASVRIRISGTRFREEGPLLITHWGFSGPVILRLSAWAARLLAEKQYQFELNINFLPDLDEVQLRNSLTNFANENKLKRIVNSVLPGIPSRLWQRVCFVSGIDEIKKWPEVSKVQINKLISNINSFRLKVSGKTTFKEEFVSCGGIPLGEINMNSMESRVTAGLFFAGEVLDIDGITGGYNFQSAWTTGFIAGSSAALKK